MQNLSEIFSYDPETGIVRWREGRRLGGRPLSCIRADGYIRTAIDGREIAAHQIAFSLMTGAIPKLVDHINRNRTDNRWCNLRAASVSQNMHNSPSRRNGLKGTSRLGSGKYLAQIKKGGKSFHLGVFETEREANAAYAGAAKILYGEFASAA